MSRAGTCFLIGQGAKILGTDAVGGDRPIPALPEAFIAQRGDRPISALREAFIAQQLDNLAALPPTGFFPLRLIGATAAPARVVAFLH